MAPHAASRFGRRLLTVLASWMLVATAIAQTDASLSSQRAAFKRAYAAASQGGDSWRALATSLKSYPLYPYLEAASLEHDIQLIDRPAVEAYLGHYPDLIPAADLRRHFLQELARRQDWNDFQAMYQPGLGDALTCDALQAKVEAGAPLDFNKDLAALWSEATLPSACDPVLQAAHDQGLLTTPRLWARIDIAADAGKGGTIANLAKWLQGDDVQAAQRLALALNDPSSAVTAAANWPDTARSRQAATLALVRLARRQSTTADTAWQTLQASLHFTPTQRDSILYALALFHATDYDSNSLTRLINLPASVQTDVSREWRVRVALAAQNWNAVLAAIEAMPPEQQQNDEWLYFRARALSELGRTAEAQSAYATAAAQSSYFGYLAADHQNTPYTLCVQQPVVDAQGERAVLDIPGMQRAFELFAVGLLKDARREWNQAMANADPQTLRQAVNIADQRGWYDRAIFTFNKGQGLSYYTLRFPLARQDGVVAQAEQAGIDPSWAYGILRQESAWVSDAQSGADARGLMQLLPSTAAEVARRNGLPWAGGDSLYDPVVNIELGTRYLAQMGNRFDGSPWLTSAAYNAGAARVGQWLDARGTLPPDLFVATMPFKETREYVARVMYYSVIYDWRLHGSAAPMSTRMTAIGQPPSRPDGQGPRKGITCAAAPAASPAPRIPAPPKPISAASAAPASSTTATDQAH
ncbi:transglycosylase SLT domain-containing protein [Dyella mobilis]|uniref:Transglycosylase SLT domain-containing protein n=1 Tax=Dyella mobilis TaxID=1849582 RepID=A0ABS2KBN9_9GAMM|nr:transglycosylase SLT domain-containing protein [Dyella mobilis]MBM7128582.1 transglycosylase SLT domain-containing protein [Dyella mobilis]GLQ99515.1 murein transglycosylase [Dyella mobilis]